jgi:hypothetical protein
MLESALEQWHQTNEVAAEGRHILDVAAAAGGLQARYDLHSN